MNLEQTAALIELSLPGPPGFSENTYEDLQALGLVRKNSDANFEITERGRVFIDHLRALPLPQQTVAWRMPGHDGSPAAAIAAPSLEDEGPAPPPPVKRKRVIPTDPEELRLEAVRLMDTGYGMNEVKEQLELTEVQAQAFFFGK